MTLFLFAIAGVCLAGIAFVASEIRKKNVAGWIGSYARQDWRGSPTKGVTKHLMFCFVDHFEPGWSKPSYETECARVDRWVREYPTLCKGRSDADGRAPVHTFFYPEEEYRPEHLDALVDLCRMGDRKSVV